VGVDRVLSTDDGALVVHAAHEMPDWRITRYRKAAVVYREQVYFIEAKTPLPAGGCRYLLKPWPHDANDPAGLTIHYDQDYVRERDALRLRQAQLEGEAGVLLLLTPLLGFLPSTVKLRLNDRYGIHPLEITTYSVFIEAMVGLCAAVIIVIDLFTGIYGAHAFVGLMRGVVAVLCVAAVDGSVRYHVVLGGGMRQYGFGEWIFRWRLT
jgi:hypothetical protein